MTGQVALLVDDYTQLRRGLGYRSPSQERVASPTDPIDETKPWRATVSVKRAFLCRSRPTRGPDVCEVSPGVDCRWRMR